MAATNKMKVALCFLTYGNLSQPRLWSQIIEKNRADGKVNAYIHNKCEFADDEEGCHLRQYCLPESERVDTQYGNISLVTATLRLFEHAFRDSEENTFFVLLSDTCVPLRPFDDIYDTILETNANIIDDWGERRMWVYDNLANPSFFDIERFTLQSQWIVLDRKTVQFFIDPVNDFTSHFGETVWAPDESYFINVAIKFDIPFVNCKTRYLNFKEDGRPFTYDSITQEELAEIQNSIPKHCFFLRKVSSLCTFPPLR